MVGFLLGKRKAFATLTKFLVFFFEQKRTFFFVWGSWNLRRFLLRSPRTALASKRLFMHEVGSFGLLFCYLFIAKRTGKLYDTIGFTWKNHEVNMVLLCFWFGFVNHMCFFLVLLCVLFAGPGHPASFFITGG